MGLLTSQGDSVRTPHGSRKCGMDPGRILESRRRRSPDVSTDKERLRNDGQKETLWKSDREI